MVGWRHTQGDQTRPMMEKVRGAVFNMILSQVWPLPLCMSPMTMKSSSHRQAEPRTCGSCSRKALLDRVEAKLRPRSVP